MHVFHEIYPAKSTLLAAQQQRPTLPWQWQLCALTLATYQQPVKQACALIHAPCLQAMLMRVWPRRGWPARWWWAATTRPLASRSQACTYKGMAVENPSKVFAILSLGQKYMNCMTGQCNAYMLRDLPLRRPGSGADAAAGGAEGRGRVRARGGHAGHRIPLASARCIQRQAAHWCAPFRMRCRRYAASWKVLPARHTHHRKARCQTQAGTHLID